MVSLLRLLNMMPFLSYNFRYSVFKKGSNVEIFIDALPTFLNLDIDDPFTFENVVIAYVFTMRLLSYLIYSYDFSCISKNITLCTRIGNKLIHEQLGRKHFPEYCDL
jgi:hypothetical protein